MDNRFSNKTSDMHYLSGDELPRRSALIYCKCTSAEDIEALPISARDTFACFCSRCMRSRRAVVACIVLLFDCLRCPPAAATAADYRQCRNHRIGPRTDMSPANWLTLKLLLAFFLGFTRQCSNAA